MRLRLLPLLFATLLALASMVPAASAQDADLAARLSAISRQPGLDEGVRRPLELARAALERARVAKDAATKARTEGLARAAVELAEARMRLSRERMLLRAAQARRATSFAEKEIARRAIERERARLSQLERGNP